MKKIATQDALALISNKESIHCFLTNPIMTPGFALVGWNKSRELAAESIETSDELYLLDDNEAFCGHRLWCKNPKGQYPEKQVFMEVDSH